MDTFLNSLTKEQLAHLYDILKNDIEGDIDFFLYKIYYKLKELGYEIN